MTVFELQTSGVGSNRSTNWATTPAQINRTVCCKVRALIKYSTIVRNEEQQRQRTLSIYYWNESTI